MHIHRFWIFNEGEGVDAIFRDFKVVFILYFVEKKPYQTHIIIPSRVFPYVSIHVWIFKMKKCTCWHSRWEEKEDVEGRKQETHLLYEH